MGGVVWGDIGVLLVEQPGLHRGPGDNPKGDAGLETMAPLPAAKNISRAGGRGWGGRWGRGATNGLSPPGVRYLRFTDIPEATERGGTGGEGNGGRIPARNLWCRGVVRPTSALFMWRLPLTALGSGVEGRAESGRR